MYIVKARPKDNLIYSVEKTRLAASVLNQLTLLQKYPTIEKLDNFQDVVQNLLSKAIVRVAENAYDVGALAVQYPIDAGLGVRLRRESLARAKQAAEWIASTTGVALEIKAGINIARALSEGRADTIAINELSLAFFGGTRYGWGLDKRARKSWLVSFLHDKDDICDDNADEGPISINDAFQSGDFIPPAHINCTCELGLSRIK